MSDLVDSLSSSLKKNSRRRLITLKKDFVYERYTYQEILNLSKKFITFLEKKNIKKGDRIAICSYNCPQYFYTFLGSLFAGVVVVPIDFSSSEKLIKKFMKKTDSKLIITSKKKILKLKNKEFVEDLDEKLQTLKNGTVKKSDEDDLVEIMFTSGTTGKPKGVMLTHRNLYSNMRSSLKVIEIDETYRMLSLLPLSHVFEQVAGFLILVLRGAQTIHLQSRKTSEIVKVMQKERITTIATVPAFFTLFKEKIEERAQSSGNYKKLQKTLKLADNIPFPLRKYLFKKIHKVFGGHLTKVICGAAALPKEVELFWERIGIKVLKGYGLTETSPVLTLTPEDDRKLGSVGKVIPGVQLKLSRENEILAKGQNVTPGYFKNKEATEKLFSDRWLKTGDIGHFDDSGHLYIRGRLKNMILKPSGLNVYPEDIEKILDKFDAVKESCVLGIEKGNDVIITAVLILNKKLTEKKIKKLVEKANNKLEHHQKIQDYITWEKKEFPKTWTMKKIRRHIRKEVKEKTHIHSKSEDKLIHILSELSHVSADEINENSKLYGDLGFDSLKVIELSTHIEEKLREEVDEYLINNNTTVADLRELIHVETTKTSLELDETMFLPIFKPFKVVVPEIAYFFISKFFTKIEVTGLENLEKIDGQVIITPNHTSHLDAPTITKYIPTSIRTNLATGAAADYFFKDNTIFHKLVAKFFSYVLGAFPMSRDKDIEQRTSVKKSFEFVGEILDRGWSLALAPEGTRTRTGKMNPFKNGIGIIIKESKLPVIPVKVEGLYEILPPKTHFPRKRGPVRLKFGKPIKFDTNLNARKITKRLEKTIKEM